jgi:hypothetical protein
MNTQEQKLRALIQQELKSIVSELSLDINEKEDPDVGDRKGSQPAAYYKGLGKGTKEKRATHFKKGKSKDDEDPSAYKPAPGDARAKTKLSKHTKKYRQMFGEAELEEISKAAEKSLRKKAEKTGMPYGILKQVYNRGLAAWRTGHRPGASQQQWGHARVNSFVTKSKGTWGGADKDLAAKVRKKKK